MYGIFWGVVVVHSLCSSPQTAVPMLDPVRVRPFLHSTHISQRDLSDSGTGQQSVKLNQSVSHVTVDGILKQVLVPLEEWLLSLSCGCQTPYCTSELLLL